MNLRPEPFDGEEARQHLLSEGCCAGRISGLDLQNAAPQHVVKAMGVKARLFCTARDPPLARIANSFSRASSSTPLLVVMP